ncbi:MAG: glycosyltransferase [Dysgonamonadaceae bacterium]
MKVCVIIVSYNFEPWIPLCLSSVKASTQPATIVVVDNASQDRTCEIIRSQYPEVVLIKNDKNLGFGKANNQGMKYALENDFDYVFLLNQDARLHPRTLEILICAASHNKDYGILSPVHLNGDGDRLDFGFAEYT